MKKRLKDRRGRWDGGEMIPRAVFSCGREAQYLGQESIVLLGVFPAGLLQCSLLGQVRIRIGYSCCRMSRTPRSPLLVGMELGPQEAPSLCM